MLKIWIAGVIGLLAIADDVSRRRISNWISITAFLSGLMLQLMEHGWRGGWAGLLGAATGGGVFLVFYLLGGMGGGDIKLMAGFGAILGVSGILEAALWTAMAGGLMAAAVILFGSAKKWIGVSRAANSAPAASIPYAPAIAAGVWLSLIPKA